MTPVLASTPPTKPPAGDAEVSLRVSGMHCAACRSRVRTVLAGSRGVAEASVDLSGERAVVRGAGLDASELARAVREAGYDAAPEAAPADPAAEVEELDRRQRAAARGWGRRALIGACCAAPLEALHVAGFFGAGWAHHAPAAVWGSAALATIAQVLVGSGFYGSAWRAARARTTNMDTLIALGSMAAYLLSAAGLVLSAAGVAHGVPSYFGESASLLALISVGHWLEARMTASAGRALRDLLALQPERAAVVDDGSGAGERAVPAAQVRAGDLVLVRPGQRVPVDGAIVSGESALDESIVTGEAIPAERGPGQAVIAGSLNTTGRLVVRATRDGRDTTVARIANLVRRARSTPTEIQRLADRVCAIFVPAVLAIAGLTFAGWLVAGWWAAGAAGEAVPRAVIHATTVLVISCPCALGLATPTAVMVGAGAAARRGILVRTAAALERFAGVTSLYLDKTGTLTEGRPRVVWATDEALALAAPLAAASTHPLSRAITAEAARRGLAVPSADPTAERAGSGLTGRVGGAEVMVLSVSAARRMGVIGAEHGTAHPGESCSVVVSNGRVAGEIRFLDEPKPDAAAAMAALYARGLELTILSGDRPEAVEQLARALAPTPVVVRAGLSPEDKAAAVRAGAAAGGVVAMVGDGVNDAPALAEAQASGGVGIAIGSGADIAMESAGVIIPSSRVSALPELADLSRATFRTVKQNLALSFVYNTVAIPVAALGLLGPMGPTIAAAAMAASDVSVLANSLRLKRRLARPGSAVGRSTYAAGP